MYDVLDFWYTDMFLHGIAQKKSKPPQRLFIVLIESVIMPSHFYSMPGLLKIILVTEFTARMAPDTIDLLNACQSSSRRG